MTEDPFNNLFGRSHPLIGVGEAAVFGGLDPFIELREVIADILDNNTFEPLSTVPGFELDWGELYNAAINGSEFPAHLSMAQRGKVTRVFKKLALHAKNLDESASGGSSFSLWDRPIDCLQLGGDRRTNGHLYDLASGADGLAKAKKHFRYGVVSEDFINKEDTGFEPWEHDEVHTWSTIDTEGGEFRMAAPVKQPPFIRRMGNTCVGISYSKERIHIEARPYILDGLYVLTNTPVKKSESKRLRAMRGDRNLAWDPVRGAPDTMTWKVHGVEYVLASDGKWSYIIGRNGDVYSVRTSEGVVLPRCRIGLEQYYGRYQNPNTRREETVKGFFLLYVDMWKFQNFFGYQQLIEFHRAKEITINFRDGVIKENINKVYCLTACDFPPFPFRFDGVVGRFNNDKIDYPRVFVGTADLDAEALKNLPEIVSRFKIRHEGCEYRDHDFPGILEEKNLPIRDGAGHFVAEYAYYERVDEKGHYGVFDFVKIRPDKTIGNSMAGITTMTTMPNAFDYIAEYLDTIAEGYAGGKEFTPEEVFLYRVVRDFDRKVPPSKKETAFSFSCPIQKKFTGKEAFRADDFPNKA